MHPGSPAGDTILVQNRRGAPDSGRRIAGYVLVPSGPDDSNARYVRVCSSISSRQATIPDRQVLMPLVSQDLLRWSAPAGHEHTVPAPASSYRYAIFGIPACTYLRHLENRISPLQRCFSGTGGRLASSHRNHVSRLLS